MNEISLIKKNALFSEMNDKEIHSFIECISDGKKLFPKDQIIVSTGDRLGRIGILLSGQLEVFKESFDGRRMIIHKVDPPDSFAEIFAFSGVTKSPVTIAALMPSEVIFLNFSRLSFTCHRNCSVHVKFLSNMLRHIASRALLLSRKIDYCMLKSLRDKILLFLNDEASANGEKTFAVPFSREGMAAYLGVDRSAFSRELGRMKKEGLIDYHKNNFTVKHK